MLTDAGFEALTTFSENTSAIIVTRAMSNTDLERLEMMLIDWKLEPTDKKEQFIIDSFAIDRKRGEESKEAPGDCY